MTQNVKIPTVEECYDLMKCYAMLPHIVAHSEQVARVAAAILSHLRDDTGINHVAVIAACLLHDITKTRSLQTREHHDISGGQLLAELGFPAIGDMVKEHVILQNFQPGGNILDKEIVYYADKRVMHDRIVTVGERVADLIARYGTTEERIRLIDSNEKQVLQLEVKIRRFMTSDLQKVLDGIDPNSSPRHWSQI
jgi:uncharacterized protein